MKIYSWAAVLVFSSSLALAQAAQAPPSSPAAQGRPPEGAANAVAPDAAVITVKGLCTAKNNNKTDDCKLVVTRAQFDQLIGALAGGRQAQAIPPQTKRQFAMQYARLLLFSTEAEKQGLESTPEGRELMQFARMQALAQELMRSLQQKAQPTPAEIQKYYDDNHDRYTELTLERIVAPVRRQGETTNEAEMKKVAEDLHQRAAGGADFKPLQAEAFEKAGLQNPPETKMVQRATEMPATHQAVQQLKVGEVSQVIQDPNGFYIYKLEERKPIPLEQVKVEIQRTMAEQKNRQEVEKLLSTFTPTLNPQYFGEAAPTPLAPGVRPPSGNVPGMPAAPPAGQPK